MIDGHGLLPTPQEVTSMLSNVFHLEPSGSFKEDNACHRNERSCNFFQRNAHTNSLITYPKYRYWAIRLAMQKPPSYLLCKRPIP